MMAANMAQIGGGQGRIPPLGNQQVSQFLYSQIMTQSVATTGWHSSVSPNMRVGHVMNIITNAFLAVPAADPNQVIGMGLTYERDAYTSSPDKTTYESRILSRVNELFKKRQANEQNIQNTLTHAAAQNQAQMMMNRNMQMGGMGQSLQQGFQSLQQMQSSPINQQGQSNFGVNNPSSLHMNTAQQMMPMTQMPPQMAMQPGSASLSHKDQAKAQQIALMRYNTANEQNRARIRTMMEQKFGLHMVARLEQEGVDPVLWFFQTQSANHVAQSTSKGQVGMNQNGRPMQPHQQRPMNQAAQQLPTGPNGEFDPFPNVERIMSQQKAGLIAQEAGQMVVPASTVAGRNATPQPLGSLPGPNQGGGQPSLQHQLPQQFGHQPAQQLEMDQRAAETQNQVRAHSQAKQMQGQPGGLSRPGGTSQSPAMNTLNAPVRRSPMDVGQPEGHPQLGQGNMPFGQQMMNPRFNQASQRPPMMANGNMKNQMLHSILEQMPSDTRQSIMSLPPDKIPEMIMKWNATRSGRHQPEMGQLGPASQIPQAMNQFNTGNNPNQNPNLNMSMDQQAQHMAQMHKLRNANMNPTANRQAIMDNMPVPPKIIDHLRQSTQHQGTFPEIKKWGQLKQWMNQKNLNAQTIQGLLSVQSNQFRTMENGLGLAAANSQLPQSNLPQQGLHPNGQAMSKLPFAPNVGVPNPNLVVTPHEFQTAKNHEKFRGLPDERIRQLLMQMKIHQMKTRAMGQASGSPAQATQITQPNHNTIVPPPPAQSANGITAPQRLQNAAPETSTASLAVQGRNVKGSQPRPTPVPAASTAKSGTKRSMPDDTVEMANASNKPNQRPQPQPGASVGPPQIPHLSPEQLASMPPDQRLKYDNLVKSRQLAQSSGLSEEKMIRLKTIGQEQHQAAAREQLPDITMTPEQYRETAQKIQAMCGDMSNFSKHLARWYRLTSDDTRAASFFKLRMRLVKQYTDGEKMTVLRDKFSITSADLDQIRSLLESMGKEIAAQAPLGMKKNLSQQNPSEPAVPQGASARPTAPTAQTVPLNAANLEKQTQALSRIRQRSTSKVGQAPAAPTTAQPPFPFGAQSPDGRPTYIGGPAVTQENLQLPARKKVKTEARTGPGPSQTGMNTNASPQGQKLSSPEMNKRQAPPEVKQAASHPKYPCTEQYCESQTTGFPTEELLHRHMEEEHIKPAENPLKFWADSSAEAFGLDTNGKIKQPQSSGSNAQSPVDTSKHTPAAIIKSEPMNPREAPMKRQGSLTGPRPNELRKTIAGKLGTPKLDLPAKSDGATPAVVTASAITSQAANNEHMGNTIDPQELLSGLTGLDMGGGGAILDMNVYRGAMEPNDTPESIKDSASSEPNSDVSDGVALNVTLDMGLEMGLDTWDPFGPGHGAATLDLGNADNPSGLSYPSFSWDDINPDFDKPFVLDTSLFSLDTS
ncbi:hypothetical protein F4777DRAFT_150271 [Nemania sp. FL0916]|nr:hypothetical protein F4777DRAFT_150271 [Nemania sp. FL0916]